MSFERNQGQAPSGARFVSRGAGYWVTFSPGEVRVHAGTAEVVMAMTGANPAAVIEGVDAQPGVTNYFMGSDPKNWITRVQRFERVRYRDVYPGIDVVFYGSSGHLEYDWIIGAGADPGNIRTRFEGVKKARLNAAGDLILNTGDGDMTWRKPLLYQGSGAGKTAVDGRFIVGRKNQVAFSVGKYDHSRPLVIDPVLSYATYLGGPGDDVVFSLAVDGQGDAYAAGYTTSGMFANQANPYSKSSSVGFIVKLNPTGTQNLGTTFIGGVIGGAAGLKSPVTAIALDSTGNVYVGGIGSGGSNAIPVQNAIQPVLNGGQNAWVAKFSGDLSTLWYCTWLGGNGNDAVADGSNGIAVDSANNLYVVGYTNSQPRSVAVPNGFPVINALQGVNNGGADDGFLVKINSAGNAIVYSTFFGGSGDDHPFGVGVDPQQRVYITGRTTSCNFPVPNALQPTHGGTCQADPNKTNNDVFLTAVKADGSGYIYSTFLGGDNEDRGRAIYVDQQGDAFITGDTFSPSHIPPYPGCPGQCQVFPTTKNAFQPIAPRCAKQSTCFGGDADAFITEVSPTGALLYSTYYGGTSAASTPCTGPSDGSGGQCGDDKGLGIVVQEAGREAGTIYVAGSTLSKDFPLANATQAQPGGGWDAFIVKIKPDANGPLFSTYFGGPGDEYAYAFGRDSAFNMYAAGWVFGSPTSFPPAGVAPLYPTYGGGPRDGFAFKISNADLAARPGAFSISSTSTATSATAGVTRATPRAVGSNFNGVAKFANLPASDSSSNASGAVATVSIDNVSFSSLCTAQIAGTPVGNCIASGNTITVNGLPDFQLGAELDVAFQGIVNVAAQQGVYLYMHRNIDSATNDPDLTNNSSSDAAIYVMNNSACAPSITTTPSGTITVAQGGTTTGSIQVTSCFGWTLTSNVSWIHASQTSGPAGSTTITYSVDPNGTTSARIAALNIGAASVVISQNGLPLIQPGPYLIWQNDGSSVVTIHNYGGTGGASDLSWNWMYSTPVPGWHVVAVADFNRDGAPDLVWQNDTTRQVVVHYHGAGGTTDLGYDWLYPGLGAAGWHVVAAADFNHDGSPDLVWQNDTTSQVTVHYYSGATDIGWAWLYPGLGAAGWHVAAAADFNGDGYADLVWQNDSTRQVTVHYYGAGAADTGWNWMYAGTGGIGWRVAGALDFNSDGVPDLIWQNDATRQVVVHYYGGAGGATDMGWNWLYTPVATGWSVVN